MGDYDRTISFGQKLLLEASDNWALIVHCYSIMGQAYIHHPELALQSYENALELQLKYDPTDFTELAVLYNNLGRAHKQLGSGKQLVIRYYEKALETCTAVSDESQLNKCLMATILNNLVTCKSSDDLNLTLKREQLVLDIRLKHLPITHPLIAITHNTLAQIYTDRGELKEALKHYDEALRIQLKYLPSSHPAIANTYCAMALLYLYQGDYENIEYEKTRFKENYNKSIELNYKALNALSTDRSSSSVNYELITNLYNNLAIDYIRLSRLDEALDCYNLLNIFLQYLPDDDDMPGILLNNKGKIFTLQGNMSKGMEFYQLAIKFYDRLGLPNSLSAAYTYFNIGEWYELSGKPNIAVEYYEHALECEVQKDRQKSILTLRCTKALGKVKNAMAIRTPIEEASWL